jgi:hypothetical protein
VVPKTKGLQGFGGTLLLVLDTISRVQTFMSLPQILSSQIVFWSGLLAGFGLLFCASWNGSKHEPQIFITGRDQFRNRGSVLGGRWPLIALSCTLGAIVLVLLVNQSHPEAGAISGIPNTHHSVVNEAATTLAEKKFPAKPSLITKNKRSTVSRAGKAQTTIDEGGNRPPVSPPPAEQHPSVIQQIAPGGTGYQANGPGATININPSLNYIPPQPNILQDISAELAVVKARYAERKIYIVVTPESGSTQRFEVARNVGRILSSYGLGYFPSDSTFIGNQPDAPITFICREEDIDLAKSIMQAISKYVSGQVTYKLDDSLPTQLYTAQLYIYGQPTFNSDGSVNIK